MKYRPEIDGLRAIAVLFVFVFHLFPQTLTGGFIGVDVFFVISGFLITSIILKKMNANQFSFLDFYSRRIKRIFPALFTLLLASSLMAIFSLGSEDFLDFFKALRYSSAQISNILFSQNTNYFQAGHEHSPLLHTWSLGVEEQFYLIWPLLLFFLTRFKNKNLQISSLFILCLFSFALSEWLSYNHPKIAFYMVYSRLWELGLGGLLAYNFSIHLKPRAENALAFIGLCLIVTSGFILTALDPFPGIHALAPVMGSILIILFTQTDNTFNLVKKILTLTPMVFIGKISYSLYLWHWPLIAFTKKYTQSEITPSQALIITAISFPLSYLSWKYIENPFRKPTSETSKSKKQVIAFGFSLMIVFIFMANGFKSFSSSSWRYISLPPYDQFKMHSLHDLCTPDTEEGLKVSARECSVGENPSNPDIILFGDSHASHFFPAFRSWAKNNKLTLQLLAASSCPPLFGAFKLYQKGEFVKRCQIFSQQSEKYILQNKTIKTVVLALRAEVFTENNDYHDPSQSIHLTGKDEKIFSKETSRKVLKKQLQYTINLLLNSGKKVILMKQAPMLKKHPLKCIESSKVLISKIFPTDDRHCYQFDEEFVEKRLKYSDHLFNKLKEEFPITVFETRDYIKSAQIDDEFYYFDDDHLNEKGSKSLVPHFNF